MAKKKATAAAGTSTNSAHGAQTTIAPPTAAITSSTASAIHNAPANIAAKASDIALPAASLLRESATVAAVIANSRQVTRSTAMKPVGKPERAGVATALLRCFLAHHMIGPRRIDDALGEAVHLLDLVLRAVGRRRALECRDLLGEQAAP